MCLVKLWSLFDFLSNYLISLVEQANIQAISLSLVFLLCCQNSCDLFGFIDDSLSINSFKFLAEVDWFSGFFFHVPYFLYAFKFFSSDQVLSHVDRFDLSEDYCRFVKAGRVSILFWKGVRGDLWVFDLSESFRVLGLG